MVQKYHEVTQQRTDDIIWHTHKSLMSIYHRRRPNAKHANFARMSCFFSYITLHHGFLTCPKKNRKDHDEKKLKQNTGVKLPEQKCFKFSTEP